VHVVNLVPGCENYVQVGVRVDRRESCEEACLINCVEVGSSALVCSWLIKIECV